MHYEFDYNLALSEPRISSSQLSISRSTLSDLSTLSSFSSIPMSDQGSIPLVSLAHRKIDFQKKKGYLYRWDTRSNEELRRSGFTGRDSLWDNKVFGNNTIFTSRDRHGSENFFRELETLEELDYGKEKFYLHKIKSKHYISVDLHKNYIKYGRDFAYSILERSNDYHDFEDYIQESMADNLERYLRDTASRNHEVQVLGPVKYKHIKNVLNRVMNKVQQI